MRIQHLWGKLPLIIHTSLFCVSALLAGCGGGGGDNSGGTLNQNPPEPTPAPVIETTPTPTSDPAPTQTPTVAPTANPTPTLPPSEDPDSDGIATSQDQCLDTPTNVAVDSKGCELSKDIEIVGDCVMSKTQQDLLVALNDARASARTCGTSQMQPEVSALSWDCQLVNAAKSHAEDMATQNYYSHEGKDGSSYSSRMAAAGYTNLTASAEIIASGEANAQTVVDNWVNNADDCMAIMNSFYHDVGIGFGENSSSTFNYYWTANLGNR